METKVRKKKKIIHVNTLTLKSNRKNGECKPPLIVRSKNRQTKTVYGHDADLYYKGVKVGSFTYQPETPLDCGATVWFETDELEIVPRIREQTGEKK